ncbi:hypothetical protein AAOGI_06790 [Agarivorans albus]
MGGSSSKQQSSSTNSSLSQAIQGNNNGVVLSGDGNVIDVTTTDLGAIDAARDITNYGVDMVGDLASSVSENNRLALQESGDLARDLLSTSVGAVGDAMADNTTIANNAVSEAGRLFDSAGNLLSDMSLTLRDSVKDGFDLSKYSIDAQSDLARDSVDAQSALANNAMSLSQSVVMDGSNLARDLAVINANQADNQLRDFYATMENTTDKALQFANNASRSDGQQLAINSNKTMMYSILAMAAILALFAAGKMK